MSPSLVVKRGFYKNQSIPVRYRNPSILLVKGSIPSVSLNSLLNTRPNFYRIHFMFIFSIIDDTVFTRPDENTFTGNPM